MLEKHPVAGKVSINASGLVGDTVIDAIRHGGVDQAVYLLLQRGLEAPIAQRARIAFQYWLEHSK